MTCLQRPLATKVDELLIDFNVFTVTIFSFSKAVVVDMSREYFGPRVYPIGSIVITIVRPLVRPSVRPSVLKYLRNRSLDFSEILHEVRE